MKLNVHKGSNVELYDEQIIVRDIIKTEVNKSWRTYKDDPFFICDVGDIVKKFIMFKRLLPNIEPFYAIKCNPDPVVLSVLAKLGVNFDCASKGEIKQVLDLGLSPERIIYANPCKQTSYIKYAAAKNVKLMTFDNEAELHKIKAHFPRAELVLRIRVDDSKSTMQLGTKFGASLDNVEHLLTVAKKLRTNVVGISFHVGSGCYSAQVFYDAVQTSKRAFEIAQTVGYDLHLLDVGGGFPGTQNSNISFKEIAKYINLGVAEFFPPSSNVRVIAEPGRFFVASSFTVVCNVTSVRENERNNEHRYMYYLNDGVYGSFNCIMFDHQSPVPHPLDADDMEEKFPASLWGPTCDSLDCISTNSLLPKLKIGDWLYFNNMGAYTSASATVFNGFKLTKKMYVCQQYFWDLVDNSEAFSNCKMVANEFDKIDTYEEVQAAAY